MWALRRTAVAAVLGSGTMAVEQHHRLGVAWLWEYSQGWAIGILMIGCWTLLGVRGELVQ